MALAYTNCKSGVADRRRQVTFDCAGDYAAGHGCYLGAPTQDARSLQRAIARRAAQTAGSQSWHDSDVRQEVKVFIILVLAAFPLAQDSLRLNELDALDPFHHLVPELIFNP